MHLGWVRAGLPRPGCPERVSRGQTNFAGYLAGGDWAAALVAAPDDGVGVHSDDGGGLGVGKVLLGAWVFGEAGVYRLICDIDDHLTLGQTASIVVDPS